MTHFRPIHVAAAAVCSSILLGMSSGTGPLLEHNSTLPQGRLNVAFPGTSGSDETSAGRGKNNNSFTATAHSGALFATASGSSNRRPTSQPGAASSNSPKLKAPTRSKGHGVSEPDPAALLIATLFGLDMRGYCSERAACRLPPSAR